jgi:hypothetical protein
MRTSDDAPACAGVLFVEPGPRHRGRSFWTTRGRGIYVGTRDGCATFVYRPGEFLAACRAFDEYQASHAVSLSP